MQFFSKLRKKTVLCGVINNLNVNADKITNQSKVKKKFNHKNPLQENTQKTTNG